MLQIAEMVLLLQQCVFIMKGYYETHSLKRVEFPDSVTQFNQSQEVIEKWKVLSEKLK